MRTAVEPSVINRKNAEHYRCGAGCDGWRLVSGDALSVIEERIPCGLGEGAHFHASARQLFYVLSGRLVIEIQGAAGERLERCIGCTTHSRKRRFF